MKIDIDQKFFNFFKNRPSFSRKEVLDFFLYEAPGIKGGTLGWKIYDLKEKNIITPIRKGIYTIQTKPDFNPILSQELIGLANRISSTFNDCNYSIWETKWINEFSMHQSNKNIIIIEIDKDLMDSLYYTLKDFTQNQVFISPNEKELKYYIPESEHPIVIKKLISRSPLVKQMVNQQVIYVPRLEKILVDLYADEKLFDFLQGSEMMHIYKNALESYNLNFTKLFGYAKRREKEQFLRKYIHLHLNHHP